MNEKLREVYECKRCESNCILSTQPDDEGNTWPDDYLDGLLCSCSKWNTRHEPQHETVEDWEKRTGETE
jgi:hypothetical protein